MTSLDVLPPELINEVIQFIKFSSISELLRFSTLNKTTYEYLRGKHTRLNRRTYLNSILDDDLLAPYTTYKLRKMPYNETRHDYSKAELSLENLSMDFPKDVINEHFFIQKQLYRRKQLRVVLTLFHFFDFLQDLSISFFTPLYFLIAVLILCILGQFTYHLVLPVIFYLCIFICETIIQNKIFVRYFNIELMFRKKYCSFPDIYSNSQTLKGCSPERMTQFLDNQQNRTKRTKSFYKLSKLHQFLFTVYEKSLFSPENNIKSSTTTRQNQTYITTQDGVSIPIKYKLPTTTRQSILLFCIIFGLTFYEKVYKKLLSQYYIGTFLLFLILHILELNFFNKHLISRQSKKMNRVTKLICFLNSLFHRILFVMVLINIVFLPKHWVFVSLSKRNIQLQVLSVFFDLIKFSWYVFSLFPKKEIMKKRSPKKEKSEEVNLLVDIDDTLKEKFFEEYDFRDKQEIENIKAGFPPQKNESENMQTFSSTWNLSDVDDVNNNWIQVLFGYIAFYIYRAILLYSIFTATSSEKRVSHFIYYAIPWIGSLVTCVKMAVFDTKGNRIKEGMMKVKFWWIMLLSCIESL